MSSQAQNPYQYGGDFFPQSVAQAGVDVRVDFIRKTYTHLTASILGFAFVIAMLLQIPAVADPQTGICAKMLRMPFSYLIAMFGLMAVSWFCQKMVANNTSVGTQYAGLIIYTVAEAIFFTPMIWLAGLVDRMAVPTAGAVTVVVFLGLTASVFMTKADFSFMRSALTIGTLGALAVGVCMIVFGADQMWMLVLMGVFVVLSCGYILYHTSGVLHHYPVGMHVAAALALFASITTLFWYVLQLVMALSGRD